MAIQLAGLSSGMDTEAMIDDLVKAASMKKTKLESDQKKLQWKQDAWKELNDEIYSFYAKEVESLKWESAYAKKKTTINDSSIASVVSSENAIEGTQSLAVTNLAKTGYLTGGQLTGATKKSTMADLGILTEGSGAININGETLGISSTTTIESLLSQLNNEGVVASFDEENQRFFISAKESGIANDFKLSAEDEKGLKILSGLKLLSAQDAEDPKYTQFLNLTAEDKQKLIDDEKARLEKKYDDSTAALTKANEDLTNELATKQSELDAIMLDPDKKREYDEAVAAQDLFENFGGEEPTDEQKELLDQVKELQKKIADYTTTINANNDTISANATAKTNAAADAEKNIDAKISAAEKAVDMINKSAGGATGAVRIVGDDAKILLNGAEFSSTSNSFSINGLTITAAGLSEKTADGKYKTTTITTSIDTDGIYDKIVNLFDKYNELLSKFEKKYNAASSRDYNMLTKDEREEMSDDEIELWEGKIKDSLLRREDSLSNLINLFQNSMLKTYEIDGKKYSLASFGISSLNYFESGEYEHNNLHIDGNEKDDKVSGNADKLKAAIAANPQTVTKFFSQLFSDFYNGLGEQAKGTEDRTRNKFYDDKALASSYDDYKKKISDESTKISDMETKYRRQFTAMEKAMAKMESQQSSIAGMLG